MRIGFMSTSIMAADMGTAALAAHQVGMNALSLSFSLGDGMQAAAVSLIGQKLGERKPQEAKHCGMLCEKIGIVMAIAMSAFYLLFGRTLYGLFFREEEIITIGVGIARTITVIVLFQICQVIFTGCLRGAGDVGLHDGQLLHLRHLHPYDRILRLLLRAGPWHLRNLDGHHRRPVLPAGVQFPAVCQWKMDED